MSVMHVRDRPGESPAILALHGMSSTAEVWDDLAARLPGRRLVAPDLPGRGPSRDVPAGPGLSGLADAVHNDARARDLGPTVVVGHSMGAFLAPIVAAGLGDQVRGVVLLDGGPVPSASPLLHALPVRALFTLARLSDRGRLGRRIPGDAVDSLTRPSRLPLLGALRAPVHLIVATAGKDEKAPAFLSDDAVRAGQALLPRLTWERVEATHESMLTHPSVAEAVRRFG